MRPLTRTVVAATAAVLVACGGTSPSPTASQTPSASPDAQTYWLRATTTQAIPPLNQFGILPVVLITGDGVAVTQGPVAAIYPGPLMPNLVGRSVSGAGQAAIIQAARDLGLLAGPTDFTGGRLMPGGIMGRLELTVDGQRVVLTGDPGAQIVCVTAPCDPQPGTPEAFGELWRRLTDLGGWLGTELGPEATFKAPSIALLVGPAPQPEPGLPQAPADWPLPIPIGEFGVAVANGAARCGTVTGADADILRPALAAANALTPWVQDREMSATFGLTVRPLAPGEDACGEVFGAG
jgi:hypothetical protein